MSYILDGTPFDQSSTQRPDSETEKKRLPIHLTQAYWVFLRSLSSPAGPHPPCVRTIHLELGPDQITVPYLEGAG